MCQTILQKILRHQQRMEERINLLFQDQQKTVDDKDDEKEETKK